MKLGDIIHWRRRNKRYWNDWDQIWKQILAFTPPSFNSPYGFSATELTWKPESHHIGAGISNHMMGNAIDLSYSPSMARMLKNMIRSKFNLTARWTDWDNVVFSWPTRKLVRVALGIGQTGEFRVDGPDRTIVVVVDGPAYLALDTTVV